MSQIQVMPLSAKAITHGVIDDGITDVKYTLWIMGNDTYHQEYNCL